MPPKSNSPLKIVWDARLVGGTNTGDSTYWTCLLSALARSEADFELHLVSDRPLIDIPVDSRIHTHIVSARNSRWWSLVTFPTFARRFKPDVVHVQYALSPLVGSNGISTVHDVSFFVGPEWFPPRDAFLLRRSIPITARRARRIITVSKTSVAEIERFLPAARGKTVFTYNACPDWIQPIPHATEVIRERFNLVDPFLLTVGTRWARKNMELAVQASEIAGYPLVVTGKGNWQPGELGSCGRSVGYVSVEELSALYSAASLYLAPSRHEGFGIPLLEAFRCGCPVLCSSGGALPEVAGDAAKVMPNWQSTDWSNAISNLMTDSSKLESLRRAGRLREREFRWDDAAAKTLKIYEEAAHDRS
jgi:glycosyltransferase involved in cell wall biosynthesis